MIYCFVTVMILIGIVLAALGAISDLVEGAIAIGFIVAYCALAYYLSQVPFIASFTYPHGFIPFVFPVAVQALLGKRRVETR